MTLLSDDFLIGVAVELTAHVLAGLPGAVKKLTGDDAAAAVRRCVDAGILAFVGYASSNAPQYAELYELVFRPIFTGEDAGNALALLFTGKSLEVVEFQNIAQEAGCDLGQYPQFDFAAALQEFEGAFLFQAAREKNWQPFITASNLLEQTKLDRLQLERLDRIVQLLEEKLGRDWTTLKGADGQIHTLVQGVYNQFVLPAPPTSPVRFPDHWDEHYLNALVTHCGGLDLTVLAASEAAGHTLTIASVFTTLYLEGVNRAADEQVSDVVVPLLSRRTEPQDGKRKMARQEKERRPITAIEAVAEVPRLVILGQPGGGKSTLVNHIATQLARQRRGDEDVDLPHWPENRSSLPVRIVLRRFADWLAREGRGGVAGDVWDYLAYLLTRWGCADSYEGVRQTLINEGGIVFFDGLDEIRQAEARRDVLKGAVASFAATEKKCQVVVTSRPYAYDDKPAVGKAQPKVTWRLPDDQFAVVTLASFAEEQIAAFCQAWYTRVMKPRRGWDRTTCQHRADWLTRTIAARPHLSRLAASPLLLTLIAQVDSSGPEAMLPNNRADLYRQMVSLLLARWENRIPLDSRQGSDVPDDVILWLEGIPTQEVRDVLAQLAFTGHAQQAHAQQGQRGQTINADGPAVEISRDALKLALVNQFDSGSKAEEIITYIQHRAGLLVDKGEGVFTFPHRTYQEFLAAHYLLSQSDGLQQLCGRLKKQPDWWREVFLLSAGSSMAVPKNVQDLLNTLLPFAPGTREMPLTPEVTTWVLIAGQTLEETNFKYHVEREKTPGGFTAVYRRVQAWLKEALVAETVLMPKVRAEVGQWLARLGDDRPGVGVIERAGVTLPDIAWSVEIPAGTYTIGDDKGSSESKTRPAKVNFPYRLARYPITNAQFQCFLKAEDRDNPDWWEGIPDKERQFREPRWTYANHPREMVSWYQAMAFCKWLTHKLHHDLLPVGPLTGNPEQYTITLPHEYEWEVAARWPNEAVQERIYPWGIEFDATKANTYEGDRIGGTTAVGLYPSGKNEALDLYDLSGNVWEWCRNRYDEPESDMDPTGVDMGGDSRVLRGVSWNLDRSCARAALRYSSRYPVARDGHAGFRVVLVVVRPPSHHHPDHWPKGRETTSLFPAGER